jgi:hypothetical protein
MGYNEVLERLRDQEGACRAEADRLRGEAERISVLLAEREAELAKLATACEVVGALAPAGDAEIQVRPVPVARIPAQRRAGDLSADEIARQIPGALGRYAGTVRVRQVAEELGLEPTSTQIERVRYQLRKAVVDGSAAASPGGLFALKR